MRGPTHKRATRRLRVADMRDTLDRGDKWTGVGIVFVDETGSHYDTDADVGILVSVRLMPDGQPLLCRLGGGGEGGLRGIWRIPPPGTEVVVALDGGGLKGELAIIGILSSGGTPTDLDDQTLVISGPKVTIVCDSGATIELKSVNGTPVPVALKSDVQAVVDKFNAHKHVVPTAGTSDAPATLYQAPDAVGTNVLLTE